MLYKERPEVADASNESAHQFSVPVMPGHSVSQLYDGILHDSVAEFVALRDELEGLESRVGPGLSELYDRRPYLRPDNLRFMQVADTTYLGYIATGRAVDVPVPTAEQQVMRLMDSASIPRATIGWNEMPIALAAASALRNSASDSYGRYQSMLANRGVREFAASHLSAHVGLFEAGSVAGLDAHALEPYGLNHTDIAACDNMAKIVTRAVTDLPRLAAPPLHLTHLAADVMNFNGDSVLPVSLTSRVAAGSLRQPSPAERASSAVTKVYGQYLRKKYNYLGDPDARLRGIMAECDLAERQGFLDADDAQQYLSARRTRKIFVKVKESDRLPIVAQAIVARSRSISR